MPKYLTRSRLDSLSDGVIAVILTIMVLEMRVPPTSQASDTAALIANAKILAIYALSFIQVGIYWVNHHYLLDDVETVTHGILWANLALLFTLSLIPFGIEWIGTRGIRPLPVAVYSVCFFLPAITWTVLAHIIHRRTGIASAAGWVKQAASSTLNLAAVGLSFWSPLTALGIIAVVALMWVAPPRRVRERTRKA